MSRTPSFEDFDMEEIDAAYRESRMRTRLRYSIVGRVIFRLSPSYRALKKENDELFENYAELGAPEELIPGIVANTPPRVRSSILGRPSVSTDVEQAGPLPISGGEE